MDKFFENIFLPILSFVLGVIATLLTQFIARIIGFNNSKRKIVLDHLSVFRERLDDYGKLFNCEYPYLPEFINVQDSLHPKSPFYSENSKKLYRALVQYRITKKVIDDKERVLEKAIHVLLANKAIRQERYNKYKSATSYNFDDQPFESRKSVLGKLELMRKCEAIIFHGFPQKVVNSIHWDRLDEIQPEDVSSLFYYKLQSRFNNDGSVVKQNEFSEGEWEKRENISNFSDKLHLYQSRALQLIAEIDIELTKLEQTWRIPI